MSLPACPHGIGTRGACPKCRAAAAEGQPFMWIEWWASGVSTEPHFVHVGERLIRTTDAEARAVAEQLGVEPVNKTQEVTASYAAEVWLRFSGDAVRPFVKVDGEPVNGVSVNRRGYVKFWHDGTLRLQVPSDVEVVLTLGDGLGLV